MRIANLSSNPCHVNPMKELGLQDFCFQTLCLQILCISFNENPFPVSHAEGLINVKQ
eukprot:TRINITY_DN292_c0_g1_i1.p2 TRINITY_DN292_c0_g1~~TRINITY_DN292_c0_g1_i1.p2  ORF type:complete len:57 (+),score=8.44 TRINITY_DN292_c0_g1_i1:219-389(+)